MAQRHNKALIIVDPGACNPKAIARELVAAIDEVCDEHDSMSKAGDDAAVRLIMSQLAQVLWPCSNAYDLWTGSALGDYRADQNVCRALADQGGAT